MQQGRVEPSAGSVGDSYDNALAETINEFYKAEDIWRRGPWRKPKPATMRKSRNPQWWRDSNKAASGKPRAVQFLG